MLGEDLSIGSSCSRETVNGIDGMPVKLYSGILAQPYYVPGVRSTDPSKIPFGGGEGSWFGSYCSGADNNNYGVLCTEYMRNLHSFVQCRVIKAEVRFPFLSFFPKRELNYNH